MQYILLSYQQAIDDVKVPEATDDLQEVEIFLRVLESKIQNTLSRINLVAQLLDQANENSLQDLSDIQDNTLSVVSSQIHTQRTAALLSTVEPTAQVTFIRPWNLDKYIMKQCFQRASPIPAWTGSDGQIIKFSVQ